MCYSQPQLLWLARAQENANLALKRYYDQKRLNYPFKVGDLVFVEGIALPTDRRGSKVSALRRGPFKIVQQINPVAFRLDTPATWRVHNVFHASYLTPHVPHRQMEPERILDCRVHRGKKELYVRFQGQTRHQDTWVDERDIKLSHPRLYLEWLRTLAVSFTRARLRRAGLAYL